MEFCEGNSWKEFYEIDTEPTPTDMPEARGVVMTCWVDASHASNKVMMRSNTGICIKLNGTPVAWYSKRQNTVESSTLGSKFVALRMFGVTIDGPTSVMSDNQSVQKNVSIPTSQLGKKHNTIFCYHKVCENVAAGWVKPQDNLADLFTIRF